MDRRNVSLIISLSLVWMSWIALQVYLNSKKPPKGDPAADDAVALVEPGEKAGADKLDADKAAEKKEERLKKDARVAAPEIKEQPAVEAERAAVDSKNPRKWLAVGSADPQSAFAGVFYFDSRGATVECVELNGPKYRSVEDYSGYLGRMNLTTPAAGGAEVRICGHHSGWHPQSKN